MEKRNHQLNSSRQCLLALDSMIKLHHGVQNRWVKVQMQVAGSIICKYASIVLCIFKSILFCFCSRVPFQKSIQVTGRLASSETQSRTIWVIVRGVENLPTNFQGFTLPMNARLVLQKIDNRLYEALDFVTVANITSGQGFLLSHTLAVSSASINFIEGCYHAYTEYDQPFPGEGISSGTEDYFDSAFTFNAGQFHFEVSGFTHFKKQDNGTFELSAYRMHDMDLIFFTNGFRFVWRNGGLLDDRGIKCILESSGHPAGSPAKSVVSSYALIYV
jgi:hypothetical protein